MWVRFPIWDRWRELTRFWIASKSAFMAERGRWTTLPIVNPNDIKISDQSGRTGFECTLDDYLTALDNKHLLYSMLLAAYIGLVEDHGRDIIEHLISTRNFSRSSFPGMDTTVPVDEAAEKFIKDYSVERWGSICLQTLGWSWSTLVCGKAAIVEIFAVRNIITHGLMIFNQTAANRIQNAGGQSSRWVVGQRVVLDRAVFGDYLHDLRAFARCLADASAQQP